MEQVRSKTHEATWYTETIGALQVRVLIWDNGRKKPLVYQREAGTQAWKQMCPTRQAAVIDSLSRKKARQAPELVITPPSWDPRSLYWAQITQVGKKGVYRASVPSNTKRPKEVKYADDRGQRGNGNAGGTF